MLFASAMPTSYPPSAYYIHQLSPFIVRFGGSFGLHWYGFAYVMAFVCGYWLYHRLAGQGYGQLAPEKVADFITLAAIFGVMLGGGSAGSFSTVGTRCARTRWMRSRSGRAAWPATAASSGW